MNTKAATRRLSGLTICVILSALSLFLCTPPARTLAQANDNYAAERARAMQLINQSKFTEALPLLEKLAAVKPADAEVIFFLGFSTLAASQTMKDVESRKQARLRARIHLLKAKEIGYEHPLLAQLLESLPADGAITGSFSKNPEAEAAMNEGEAAFVQGDLDKALTHYQRALQLDPKLYEAALFAGDMHNKKNQPERAGEWFARAIEINPFRETAYRYWGISFVKQDKTAEARDKFIEAAITEPYNRLARNGLIEWAKLSNVRLAHPTIEIPTNISSPEKEQTTINIDPKSSPSWAIYGLTRASWRVNNYAKFNKEYPGEKTYRHSLREEAEALRMVAEAAAKNMKSDPVAAADQSLVNLVKLNNAGLLEAYILLARADEGIAKDFATYLKMNRDKLRRYMVEYLLTGGGQ